MPCRVDVCDQCCEQRCICGTPYGQAMQNVEPFSALCDALRIIERVSPGSLRKVDPYVLRWWRLHKKRDEEMAG